MHEINKGLKRDRVLIYCSVWCHELASTMVLLKSI